jgi:pilus assembly protein CpaF
VQVIVQVSRLQDGTRKITHVSEVRGLDGETGRYDLHDLFVRRFDRLDDHGKVQSRLVATGELPSFLPQLREHGVDLPSAMYDAARSRAQEGAR